MDNNKKIKKSKRGLKLVLILIAIYLFILVFESIKPSGTVRVVYGNVKSSYKSEGMIIRNEKVIYSPQSGYVIRKVQNNTRVPKGYLVAQISSKKLDENLYMQLENINNKIKLAEDKNLNTFTNDIDKIDNEIFNQLNTIKADVARSMLPSARNSIDKLSLLLEKKNAITINNPFTNYNIEQLKKEKVDIENLLKNLYVNVNSPDAGIISYDIDGYENININNVFNNNVFNDSQKEKLVINEEKDHVNTGEPLFKVIDNFDWYIFAKIAEKNLVLKNDEKVKLNINGYILEAKTKTIIHNDDGDFVLFQSSQQFDDFLNDRFVNFEIIKNSEEGMMLPNEAIINKNGKCFVYIYDIGGIKEVEVNVLSTDGKNSIIDNIDKLNGLKIYDEVVSDKNVLSKYLDVRE
ncbi:MAG: HlyD family efflux transporter periplasmic adaptor subunit [Thermoanaerobacteraceae bacterium]|nr:HlyD family efflux transporter periplasmic adaptor subunit [Thermoanaerobacteraceae bacterium]